VKKPLFWTLFANRKKNQKTSMIPLIVIKTFVPSTPSIIDQKPKTKTLAQKQVKTTKTQKPFSPSLPLEDQAFLRSTSLLHKAFSKVKNQKPTKPFPSFLPSQPFDPLIL
jgi:hypothetical protein